MLQKLKWWKNIFKTQKKIAEGPQNFPETQGIFAKTQGKFAEGPKMFAKI